MPFENTLLGLLTGGKYQTSKQLPEIKNNILPILEMLTGASAKRKSPVGLLDLAMAVPVVGKGVRLFGGSKQPNPFKWGKRTFDPRNIFVSKEKDFVRRYIPESGGKILEFNVPKSYFNRYGEQLIHTNEKLYKTPRYFFEKGIPEKYFMKMHNIKPR